MNDVFITENFLLQNDRAVELYHRFARDLPIIDYHCHLPPRQIAEDHRFANLAQIWLHGDHYKWRAMRSAGVAERYCTGDATDWEKFEKWAEVVPKTLRNPLYHWTHLELKRPLGISDRLLNPQTARGIWEQGNAALARDDMSCRGIMRQMKVVLVCTTDDPADSLEYHAAIAADATFKIRVLPTFRPDRALAIDGAGDLQSLRRPFGRSEPRRYRRRLSLLSRCLAAAARFLPQGRLPAFRPRAGDRRRGGRHGPGSDGHFRPGPSRQPALGGGEGPLPLGHAP